MQLDSYTLLVTSCVALFFIGSAMLYFWNRDRSATWLLWWSTPFFLACAGSLVYLRPDWQNDFVVLTVGNATRIAAIGFLWAGTRAFDRRKPLIWPLLAVPVAWILLCLFPWFAEDVALRIVAFSLINLVLSGLAAWELWRGREERLPSRMAAVAVFTAFAFVMAVRVVGAPFMPFPFGALPLDPVWMGVFNLIIFVLATSLCLLLVSMTRERAESEQRTNALIDPLTGMMNRRAFMAQIEHMARRATHARGGVAMLVLDLDKFKRINDAFGHEVGDRVLEGFASVAERCIRSTDLLYRLGGEEFCCILPDAGRPEAVAVAERIRTSFAAHTIDVRGRSVGTTVSIGIAVSTFAGLDPELLLSAADTAVYEAKARGRNRVVVADPSALSQRPDPLVAFDRRRRA